MTSKPASSQEAGSQITDVISQLRQAASQRQRHAAEEEEDVRRMRRQASHMIEATPRTEPRHSMRQPVRHDLEQPEALQHVYLGFSRHSRHQPRRDTNEPHI